MQTPLSGFYALACGKEAGPRGSWTEEQEREGDRESSDYTENRLRQRTDGCTGTRHNKHREREQKATQMGTTTNMYLRMPTTNQSKMLQPSVGHEIDSYENEQGGEQMPIPACCDAQKQNSRSEVLQDALGAFHEQREPPRTLHRYAMEQKTENEQEEREAPNRFGSTSSSLREMFSSSSTSSFYSPSRGRLALTAHQPNLPT